MVTSVVATVAFFVLPLLLARMRAGEAMLQTQSGSCCARAARAPMTVGESRIQSNPPRGLAI